MNYQILQEKFKGYYFASEKGEIVIKNIEGELDKILKETLLEKTKRLFGNS